MKNFILTAEDENLEELTLLVEEVQGNLEHIYRSVEDLKALCRRPSYDEEVDRAVTRELAEEIDNMIRGMN